MEDKMEELKQYLNDFIEQMGFGDFSVRFEEESGRFLIFINEERYVKKNLPILVQNIDYLFRLMAEKKGVEKVLVDINNYRKERENIIVEIARGAARKAAATKTEVTLPAMNAYERRLIHMELASRPDVATESVGEGKNRYVVVKPL